jgi:hypothetical protein
MRSLNSFQTFSVVYLFWLILFFYAIGSVFVDMLGLYQIIWLRASSTSTLFIAVGGLIATRYADHRLSKMEKDKPKN